MSGVLLRFLGWLVDQWLGHHFLVALGIVAGAVLGLYLTFSRFNGRSTTADTSVTEQTDDVEQDDAGELVRRRSAVLASGEEFTPPGPADFNLPPIFGGDATF